MSEKLVSDLFGKAEKEASKVVEKMARDILNRHEELDEFIMGMGTYLFTYKKGGNLDPKTQKMNLSGKYIYSDSKPFLKPLNSFIDKWDETLRMTGETLRFTAKGSRVTKW